MERFLFQLYPQIYESVSYEEFFDPVGKKYVIDRINAIFLMDKEAVKSDYSSEVFFYDIYTDYEHPYVLKNVDDIVYQLMICPEYFKKNSKEVKNLVGYILKNTLFSQINLDASIVCEEVLKSAVENFKIKVLSLGENSATNFFKRDHTNEYSLTKKDYDILANTHIEKVYTALVDEEIKDVINPIIAHNVTNKFLNHSNYGHDIISLGKKITDSQLEDLRYLNDGDEIFVQLSNILDLIRISGRLIELKKKSKVILNVKEVENKEKVFQVVSKNTNYLQDNIFVYLYDKVIPMYDFVSGERILYDMTLGVEGLSPFLRYMYVYNLTKHYKKYLENEEDHSEARDLYKILNNQYIVCLGYTNLLEELSFKVGIRTASYTVGVEPSRKELKNPDAITSNDMSLHARTIVHLQDSSYGIDGFFVSDPTWDSSKWGDYYNHFLLTPLEETYSCQYNQLFSNRIEELLNITSMDEFFRKIKFMLGKKDSSFTGMDTIILKLVRLIHSLDPSFYFHLQKKYPDLEGKDNFSSQEERLYEIGEYLLSKVNHPVSGETIVKGAVSLYQGVYHYSPVRLRLSVSKMIYDNQRRQKCYFPKRYKMDLNGDFVLDEDISEKFSILPDTKRKR